MKSYSRLIVIYFVVIAIEALLSIIWLAGIPAESGSALVLGYSAQRMLLMLGFSVASGVLLAFSGFLSRRADWQEKVENLAKGKWAWLILLTLFTAAWIALFLPSERWMGWAGYKTRLLPVIWWVLLASLQAILLVLINFAKKSRLTWHGFLGENRLIIRMWGLFSLFISAGVASVAVLRLGLVPDIVYWNDINVPLLSLQVLGVVLGVVVFISVLKNLGFQFLQLDSTKTKNTVLIEIVFCVLIWGLTAILWTQTTMPHSYFSPGPYPPNGEMYPFSDAAGYDTTAHVALIGDGLGANFYVDKPLYVSFLAFIHLLVGNRMQPVIGLQVAVIALLPVILYLLGRKLHSRLAGFLAAGFVILREVNNIQGTLWVLSTNTRLLMSESLVTLLLAASLLLFVNWILDSTKKTSLMISGGLLGLAGLVRLNPFLLLPVALAVVVLYFWKNWKQGLIHCLLFAGMFMAAILPWSIQSWVRQGKILFFQATVHGVLWEQRTFYSLNQPLVPTGKEMQEQIPITEKTPTNRTWNRITGISRYVSAHFTHNLISAVAILPTSFRLDSLDIVIHAPNSYWSKEGVEGFTPIQFVFLGINLGVVALGAAAVWKRQKWSGLIPAGFLLTYSLATAAARTSGGRYILPGDWVVMLYFALGIAQFFEWGVNWLGSEKQQDENIFDRKQVPTVIPLWKTVGVGCIFLLLGGTPIILDQVIPARYLKMEKTEVTALLQSQGLMESLPISAVALDAFLSQPESVAYQGRALYPRYYSMNKGEPDGFSYTRSQGFPRLTLQIIGSQSRARGVLPLQNSPDLLPNGVDVVAIGCKGELNDEWLALVVYTPQPQVILRDPASVWKCPVKLPVCNDNRICR